MLNYLYVSGMSWWVFSFMYVCIFFIGHFVYVRQGYWPIVFCCVFCDVGIAVILAS